MSVQKPPQNLRHARATDAEMPGELGTGLGDTGVEKALVEASQGQRIAVNTSGFGTGIWKLLGADPRV